MTSPPLDRIPSAGAYEAALFRVRARAGQLTASTADSIRRAMLAYVDELGKQIATLTDVDRLAILQAQRNVFAKSANALQTNITNAIAEGRNVTFRDVQQLMRRAGENALKEAGASAALLGGIRLPAVSMLGAYESLGAAQTWRTLLSGHVANAAGEANAIVRQALLLGTGPEELSRRLRAYVVGSEPFQGAFGDLIDLRKIPIPLRQQAGRMLYNADRIAFSELGNARHEAEIQHFVRDPMVRAIRWTLSPNRGAMKGPDVCDLLARSDYYGLGKGVYPVRKVPPKPHPFDRCELRPVLRPLRQLKGGKPNPDRLASALTAPLDLAPGPPASLAQIASARLNAERVLRFADLAPSATNPLLSMVGTNANQELVQLTKAAKLAKTAAKTAPADADAAATLAGAEDVQAASFPLEKQIADVVPSPLPPPPAIEPIPTLQDAIAPPPPPTPPVPLTEQEQIERLLAKPPKLKGVMSHQKFATQLKETYPTVTAEETLQIVNAAFEESFPDTSEIFNWWVDGGLTAKHQAAGSLNLASVLDKFGSGKLQFPGSYAGNPDKVNDLLLTWAGEPGVTLAQLADLASLGSGKKVFSAEIETLLAKHGKHVIGMDPPIVAASGNAELAKLLEQKTKLKGTATSEQWEIALQDTAATYPGATVEQLQTFAVYATDTFPSAGEVLAALQDAGGVIDGAGVVSFPVKALPTDPFVFAVQWLGDYAASHKGKPSIGQLFKALRAHYPDVPEGWFAPQTLAQMYPKQLRKLPGVKVSAKVTPTRATPAGTGPTSDRVLAEKIGDAKGSNPGGLYRGSDGVVRYVKFYDDPSQAMGEHLANRVYRAVGVNAPDSLVFEFEGKIAYASVVEEGQTLQALALTKERAEQVLDGFAADVLVGNWDAVGTGLDNIFFTADGRVLRIDNGGSLLFRAKAGRKPSAVLDAITEWEGFADPSKNPYYRKVFDAAGVTDGLALGERALAQIDRIEALVTKGGGDARAFWTRFVDDAVPSMADADRASVRRMLERRTELLIEKRAEITAYLETQKEVLRAAKAAARRDAALRKAGKNPDAIALRPGADGRMKSAAGLLDKQTGEIQRILKRIVGSPQSDGSASVAAARGVLQRTRRDFVARELAATAKISLDEAKQMADFFDEMVSSFAGSSNNDKAGILKLYAERRHGALTTYHKGFLDTVAALRNQFIRDVEEKIASKIAQFQRHLQPSLRQHFDYMMDLHHEFGVAASRWGGKQTIRLYRGVSEKYFHHVGEAVPKVGTTGRVAMNSVASWSTDKRVASNFGAVVFEIEVPVENVLVHWGTSNDLLNEAEWIVIGKPVTYTIVPRWS